MKKTVLFLDDEVRILEGLRRMLRHMRKEWDMVFTEDPGEAMRVLAERPVDVVVSDMRMPVMNGVAFLDSVKKSHPGTARIVLSGHSDEDLTLRSVKIAHQYLAKPCDAETLKATVARACSIRDLLSNAAILEVVSGMDTLPSLPNLYTEIMNELQSPDASVQKVGAIVATDPAMTAKLLQVVNSAFFGLRRRVSDPAQAVNFLGLDTVKSLVLAVGIFAQFDSAKIQIFSLDRLWDHSVRTADCARTIAKRETENKQVREDAFLAGLLHDTGKLVLASNYPEDYGHAIEAFHGDGGSLRDAEWEVFKTSHAEVGAYLMGLWGLPDAVVAAIAFHHSPSQFAGQDFHALTAVHGADLLENASRSGNVGPPDHGVDTDYLTRLRLSDPIPRWREDCRSILEGEA